jgi:hypothetical protein
MQCSDERTCLLIVQSHVKDFVAYINIQKLGEIRLLLARYVNVSQ